MKLTSYARSMMVAAGVLLVAHPAVAQPELIAVGALDASRGDRSGKTRGPLENGVPGNLFGGIGSGLGHAGGDRFIAVPDRGPNAVDYNACVDNTASYITRFHELRLRLKPNNRAGLPFVLTPSLEDTVLLSSSARLNYGNGTEGCPSLPAGAPALNERRTFYFTGRSDNFGAGDSLDSSNARFDPESVRIDRNGKSVFISDEYGPHIYRFDRETGRRTRVYTLPAKFAVSYLSPMGDEEIAGNASGRVANKGMEALAITPDGSTLVGVMQSALIQDGGDAKGQVLRIVVLDVESGAVLHEYAYPTDGEAKYTVSDIVAVNDHVFLVDERDGKGLGDDSEAKVKKLYLIDLANAVDVSNLAGRSALAANAVTKRLFLDIVAELKRALSLPDGKRIPAKLEGIALGEDVKMNGVATHTLYVANDNDFLATVAVGSSEVSNPNQFFVFGFSDADLQGATFVPQVFRNGRGDDADEHSDRDDDRD